MIQLRDYQQAVRDGIYQAWESGCNTPLAVIPTGGGKTVLFSDIVKTESQSPVAVLVHRKELVGQISLALARVGVAHRVIGSSETQRFCTGLHLTELGCHFHNTQSDVAVVSVDTLVTPRNQKMYQSWCRTVKLWVMDEAHHVLRENKWGTAVAMFPNARGLGVTATPLRADGKGLGLQASGVFQQFVIGPTMRELIDRSHLSEYKIIVPMTGTIRRENLKVGSTGDFTQASLKAESERAQIVGNIVDNWFKFANDKQTIVFCTDVESSCKLAQRFRDAGVEAQAVDGKTSDSVRSAATKRFKQGQIKVLINVDLFGEGYDVPAVECVIMARPTESYGLYVQQFGRALRTAPGKTHAIIIDHVGNVNRHKLPDHGKAWTLNDRDKRAAKKEEEREIPLKTCVECFQPYEAFYPACPHCGKKPEPASRSKPEEVEGDLAELSPEALAILRGDEQRVNGPPLIPSNATPVIRASIMKRHQERKDAQSVLRQMMMAYSGYHLRQGHTVNAVQRMFWHRFKIDVQSAKSLGRPDAERLTREIAEEIRLLTGCQ